MRKAIILAGLLIMLLSFGYSNNRTEGDAINLASSFIKLSGSSLMKAPGTIRKLRLAYSSTKTVSPFFYVYNIGENNGYVIVSGNDRAKDILGYADEGSFDATNIPENMKSWLTFYETELQNLDNLPVTATPVMKSNNEESNNSSFATSIAPLLVGIKWNQSSPYNNLCPMFDATTRCVTGCVATGMAQVMKYHSWPLTGLGSKTYTSKTLNVPLTVDFSATSYDWANMSDYYNSTSTDIQKNAVANLMYSCGVSVNMDYGKSSSASSFTMAKSLITYFNYDSNIQFFQRDYYSKPEWADIIKTELNASRPVLYDGQATTGGHLFVCDGYDANGLFHFNWGWGGSSNGYFELSVLNPADQGIGGTAGGYNASQGITTGIQKPNTTSVSSYRLCSGKLYSSVTDSIDRTTAFTMNLQNLYDNGINTFGGYVALALYDNNNALVQILKNVSVSRLLSGSGWTTFSFSTVTMPTTIAVGEYKLYAIYRATEENVWQKVRQKIGTTDYVNLTVTDTKLKFYTTRDAYPQFNVNSLSIPNNYYLNKTGRVSVNITNTGGEYNSTFTVILQSDSLTDVTQTISSQPINIAAGVTKNIDFSGNVTVATGNYHVNILYDSLNIRSNGTTNAILRSLPIKVLPTPTGITNLVLTHIISFDHQPKVDKNNAVLTAHIKNTDGYFDNRMVANIYPKNGGSIIATLGNQNVTIEKGQEVTVNFSGIINLNPSTYSVDVCYYSTSNTWKEIAPSDSATIIFALVDNLSSLSQPIQPTNIELYPNPAQDKISLKSDKAIINVTIFDVSGRQVLFIKPEKSTEIAVSIIELNAGTYILRIETEGEIKTGKFIRR
jgi:Peptidase C10 family/Spi protease inhibitor/Secretion system C-terminal sorting domain